MGLNGIKYDYYFILSVGLYKDGKAAFDYLLQRKDINHNKLYIFGRSLGGAVAIQLASEPTYSCHTQGLIVENTFTSLPNIAKHLFDFKVVKYLPLWCFKNKVAINRIFVFKILFG